MTTTDTPANPPLRLRAGGTYVTEDGSRVTLIAFNNHAWPFTAAGQNDFWSDGVGKASHARNGQSYSDRYQSKGSGANIVAEWAEPDRHAPTPVQTHTTVRTVIVPGTYGRVRVYSPFVDDIAIKLTERNGMADNTLTAVMTAEELRNTAATLTELARGLDKIAAEKDTAK